MRPVPGIHPQLAMFNDEGGMRTARIDIHGDGTRADYKKFFLEKAETIGHEFPDSVSPCWIRVISDEDTTATALLIYR